ncbi:MAG: beta-ketoacyl-ACP synthase [Verrucomicrobiales bacterium]|nr:beta-ketoacyl-ACP synthase [Verrucomicrobiales bacterium]
MNPQRCQIAGLGKFLPERRVSAEETDALAGLEPGWTIKHSGVHSRYFAAVHETASWMGARAAERALAQAGLSPGDVDGIVCASGTMQQPVPCTAALMQRELGPAFAGVPSFDINATCLSFVVALDHLAPVVASGRYRNLLLISSELASPGIDWSHPESCTILGDGAAAAVIRPTPAGESSAVLASGLETWAEAASLTEIRGGGTGIPGSRHDGSNTGDYLFRMEGKAVFRFASGRLPAFTARLLGAAGLRGWEDLKLVIPHQGSLMAMRLLRKRLGIPEERFFVHAQDGANTIAATIPIGLHDAWAQGRIGRGDRIALMGTSAGLSIGGVILEL